MTPHRLNLGAGCRKACVSEIELDKRRSLMSCSSWSPGWYKDALQELLRMKLGTWENLKLR